MINQRMGELVVPEFVQFLDFSDTSNLVSRFQLFNKGRLPVAYKIKSSLEFKKSFFIRPLCQILQPQSSLQVQAILHSEAKQRTEGQKLVFEYASVQGEPPQPKDISQYIRESSAITKLLVPIGVRQAQKDELLSPSFKKEIVSSDQPLLQPFDSSPKFKHEQRHKDNLTAKMLSNNPEQMLTNLIREKELRIRQLEDDKKFYEQRRSAGVQTRGGGGGGGGGLTLALAGMVAGVLIGSYLLT